MELFVLRFLLQKFPDITFCNVNPLGNSLKNLKWNDYRAYILGKSKRWPFDKLSKQNVSKILTPDVYDRILFDLISPAGYFANFPIPVTTTLNRSDSNQAEFLNTIIELNVFDWAWKFDQNFTDSSLKNIRLRWHPNYHHCYTLQVPENQNQVLTYFL